MLDPIFQELATQMGVVALKCCKKHAKKLPVTHPPKYILATTYVFLFSLDSEELKNA